MKEKRKLRFFLDTEFNEHARRFGFDPISIALVPEDASEENFYAVSSEFDIQKITPWLQENVVCHLPPPDQRLSNDKIRDDIVAYLSKFAKDTESPVTDVEIWALNGSSDNVVLAQFFGSLVRMRRVFNEVGLPSPQFRDLKELIRATGGEKLPPPENAHNCLEDAIWARKLYNHLVPKLSAGQKFLVE